MEPPWVHAMSSAGKLLLLDCGFCQIPNFGSGCVSDPFICSWDPFPPWYEGLYQVLLYLVSSEYPWEVFSGMDLEQRGGGRTGTNVVRILGGVDGREAAIGIYCKQ